MRWRLRALTACALGACALAPAPSRAGGEPRVAILPVVVHSAAQDPSYLSDGLSDMLAARLEQLGGMRVVHDENAREATSRLPQAIERARSLDADFVVFGSFTQFGDGASLDVQCAPVHGSDPAAARALFVQSGAIGDIIPKLDDLADKVAYYVLGDAAGKAAVDARNGSIMPMRDLIRRLEALERAVYQKTPAAPAAEPAKSAQDGDSAEKPQAAAPASAPAAKPADKPAAKPAPKKQP
jgi:TolB-like protein